MKRILAFLIYVVAAPTNFHAVAETIDPRGLTEHEGVRPDLSKVRAAGLTKALASPEALWDFITAPETDYTERRAAVVQGSGVFPLSWLPRLLAAQAELGREEALHGWRMQGS